MRSILFPSLVGMGILLSGSPDGRAVDDNSGSTFCQVGCSSVLVDAYYNLKDDGHLGKIAKSADSSGKILKGLQSGTGELINKCFLKCSKKIKNFSSNFAKYVKTSKQTQKSQNACQALVSNRPEASQSGSEWNTLYQACQSKGYL